MSSIVHHLLARGIEATRDHYYSPVPPGSDVHTTYPPPPPSSSSPSSPAGAVNVLQSITSLRLPHWGIALLWATALAYVLTIFFIRYACGVVVATLTMIETPTATAIIRTPPPPTNDDATADPDAPLPSAADSEKTPLAHVRLVEQELFLVKSKPITSSLLSTLAHLRSRTGSVFSPMRGLLVAILYYLAYDGLLSLLSWPFGLQRNAYRHHAHPLSHAYRPALPLARALLAIVTNVLLARFLLIWTHVVIAAPPPSSPSSTASSPRLYKLWCQRFRPRSRAFRAIAGATAFAALSEQVAIMLPATLFHAFGLAAYVRQPMDFEAHTSAAQTVIILQALAVVLSGLVAALVLIVPANVALTRVQAALLPAAYDAIVPFDRSFGGRAVADEQNEHNTGNVLSVRDAWRSFDRAALWRLLGVYVKVALLHVIVAIAFVLLVAVELRVMLGSQLDAVLGMVMHKLSPP